MIPLLSVIHFIALAFLIAAYLSILILSIMYLATPLFVRVPYIPIPQEVLENIFIALELDNASTLYDMGSGDGRVLIYAAEQMPGAKYFGIEKAPFPFVIATYNLYSRKLLKKLKPRIVLLREDFFDPDLSRATHIFAYLFPDAMDSVLERLKKSAASK